MRILFLTAPEPPSPLHRIRALNLIKYLSRRHTISLVSFTGTRHPSLAAVQPYCREITLTYRPAYRSLISCLSALRNATPLEVAYCRDRRMERAVRAVVARHGADLIYIKRLRCAQYVPADCHVPCVLDTTDAMSWYYGQAKRAVPWYRKPVFSHEALSYRRYERQMLARFPHWITCSQLDAAYLKQLAPPATRIWVVPNGVDTEEFPVETEPAEHHALLLSGLMEKFVNIQAAVWFTRDILPRVARAVPDVRLSLVGPRPAPAVRRLSSERVTVTGAVPHLRPYLARAEVVVCPVLTGVGTRNKILQAWSVGRPVVTTSKGLEGLDAAAEREVLVADDAETFAEQIARLLRDPILQQRLVASGLALVQQRYRMGRVIGELEEVLARVARQRPPAPPARTHAEVTFGGDRRR